MARDIRISGATAGEYMGQAALAPSRALGQVAGVLAQTGAAIERRKYETTKQAYDVQTKQQVELYSHQMTNRADAFTTSVEDVWNKLDIANSLANYKRQEEKFFKTAQLTTEARKQIEGSLSPLVLEDVNAKVLANHQVASVKNAMATFEINRQMYLNEGDTSSADTITNDAYDAGLIDSTIKHQQLLENKTTGAWGRVDIAIQSLNGASNKDVLNRIRKALLDPTDRVKMLIPSSIQKTVKVLSENQRAQLAGRAASKIKVATATSYAPAHMKLSALNASGVLTEADVNNTSLPEEDKQVYLNSIYKQAVVAQAGLKSQTLKEEESAKKKLEKQLEDVRPERAWWITDANRKDYAATAVSKFLTKKTYDIDEWNELLEEITKLVPSRDFQSIMSVAFEEMKTTNNGKFYVAGDIEESKTPRMAQMQDIRLKYSDNIGSTGFRAIDGYGAIYIRSAELTKQYSGDYANPEYIEKKNAILKSSVDVKARRELINSVELKQRTKDRVDNPGKFDL